MCRPQVIARPTAIICRWPPESADTGRRASTASPSCLQVLGRLAVHAPLVHQPERARDRVAVDELAVQEEVLHHVERVHEREVLVDGLDPERARRLGRERAVILAVDQDRARVGTVHARQALDERGLAGAVVADEPEHLAAAELEVDAVERLHRAVRLRDPARLEDDAPVAVSLRLAHRTTSRAALAS